MDLSYLTTEICMNVAILICNRRFFSLALPPLYSPVSSFISWLVGFAVIRVCRPSPHFDRSAHGTHATARLDIHITLRYGSAPRIGVTPAAVGTLCHASSMFSRDDHFSTSSRCLSILTCSDADVEHILMISMSCSIDTYNSVPMRHAAALVTFPVSTVSESRRPRLVSSRSVEQFRSSASSARMCSAVQCFK
jgi:hypothetical protein